MLRLTHQLLMLAQPHHCRLGICPRQLENQAYDLVAIINPRPVAKGEVMCEPDPGDPCLFSVSTCPPPMFEAMLGSVAFGHSRE